MIVEKMDVDALINETIKDYEDLTNVITDVVELKRKNEFLKKAKPAKRHVFKVVKWTAPSGNRWDIVPYVNSFSDYEKHALRFNFYARFELYNSTGAASFDGRNVAIFTPHFFQRYRERFLMPNGFNDAESVAAFISRNIDFNLFADPNGADIYGGVQDGYLIGNRENGKAIIKTFVCFDMLGTDQEKIKALSDYVTKHKKRIKKHNNQK